MQTQRTLASSILLILSEFSKAGAADYTPAPPAVRRAPLTPHSHYVYIVTLLQLFANLENAKWHFFFCILFYWSVHLCRNTIINALIIIASLPVTVLPLYSASFKRFFFFRCFCSSSCLCCHYLTI